MKEEIQEQEERLSCDNCKCIMEYDTITLEYGYGSLLDGTTYNFCSDKCLKEFVKGLNTTPRGAK